MSKAKLDLENLRQDNGTLQEKNRISKMETSEIERDFTRIKRDLAFSKDEISRLARELSGKMGLEDDIRVVKQRNFDHKLKMDEMKSYNLHLEKFNAMLKRNEEELKRKLRAYDIALSRKPVRASVSPERKKFIADYMVPDIASRLPGDKTEAYE